MATLSIKGFNSFVSSTIAPIATGWNNKLPDGTYPVEDQYLSRRTER